jgi:hypothetical protein
VKNALLAFRSNHKSADYHDSMSVTDFSRLVETKHLPNLAQHSSLVLDNASCYWFQENKKTNCSEVIETLIKWLTDSSIALRRHAKGGNARVREEGAERNSYQTAENTGAKEHDTLPTTP